MKKEKDELRSTILVTLVLTSVKIISALLVWGMATAPAASAKRETSLEESRLLSMSAATVEVVGFCFFIISRSDIIVLAGCPVRDSFHLTASRSSTKECYFPSIVFSA